MYLTFKLFIKSFNRFQKLGFFNFVSIFTKVTLIFGTCIIAKHPDLIASPGYVTDVAILDSIDPNLVLLVYKSVKPIFLAF